MKKLMLAAIAAMALAQPAAGAATSAASVKALHALFDSEWERGLRENPETASFLGDTRFNDRWADLSPEAIERSHQGDLVARRKLAAIWRQGLPKDEQLNYDLFRKQLDFSIEGYRFRGFVMPVSPINWSGFGGASQLAQAIRFATAKDYEDWLKRLGAYGAYVDQHIALMKRGLKEGRVPPKVTMQRIPRQVDAQIVQNPEDSPLYAPFRNFPASMDAAQQEALRTRGREAIRTSVIPAWQHFKQFFEAEYLPGCRDAISAETLPDGAALYAFQVRLMTTTDLTPDQIHDIGLKEVERIRREMEKIKAKVGFAGPMQEFFTSLRSDPKFYYAKPDDLLNGYRVIAKRVDPELARLFGRLPRTPYGVKAIPEDEAPNSTTAYYYPPAEDGSRPGWFYANTYKLETRPSWEMEALSLHESVPGHHLQIALAQELGELPKFRRNNGYTAFVEGWGLYSESLGEDLGMYQDPYSKFGQLTYEMWRAVRLVVDTGIHHKRWTREQAIAFFKENAAKTENDIAVEVDRYISWPAQALAYKIGQLKIRELRTRAEQKLADRFDVRAFHDVVLGSGAVPLDVLERNVDAWIAAVAAKKG
ncbi:MAG TPA: DUF885 domain-containing protein [Candidatus Binatia bacterium]|nr:DUF885 domain-containing protein [Candidatus Binatia bacterium]